MRLACFLLLAWLVSPSTVYAAETPDAVTVGEGFRNGEIEVSAAKAVKEPADLPTQVKHGTDGVQVASGEVACNVYSDGEIVKTCWNPTPEDCFGQGLDTNLGVNRCAGAQAPPPPAPTAIPTGDPRNYAINYFRSLPLPTPQPLMSSPQGICGAEHSLDLRIPSQLVFTDPSTPFGALAVHVHGRFDVDWGDGKHDTYFSSGAPWPRSELVHYWENVGQYDVSVAARWSADWTYGDYSGSLGGLTTSNVLQDWPVIQLQAVLVR